MAKKKEEPVVDEAMVDEFDGAVNPPENEIERYSDEDRVEIPPLFYDKERYSAPVSVIVNGKAYLIPRGKAGITVPRVVKEVLEQSEYQKQMASDYIRANEGIKNLGDF